MQLHRMDTPQRSWSRAMRSAGRATAVVGAALSLGMAVPALASGPAPVLSVIAPTGTVAKGNPPTFKVKLTKAGRALVDQGGPYAVFVIVSPSSARDGQGVLRQQSAVFLAEMKRVGGRTLQATPKRRSYPQYWLNRGGSSYFWQAYIVRCAPGKTDCKQEIEPRKLRISGG